MSVKIKMRGNDKAIVRFNNQMEQQYFIHIMRLHRDDKQHHPEISIKSVSGAEYPKMPQTMMPQPNIGASMGVPGQPIVQNLKPNIVQPSLTEMGAKGAIIGMEAGKEIKQSKEEKK